MRYLSVREYAGFMRVTRISAVAVAAFMVTALGACGSNENSAGKKPRPTTPEVSKVEKAWCANVSNLKTTTQAEVKKRREATALAFDLSRRAEFRQDLGAAVILLAHRVKLFHQLQNHPPAAIADAVNTLFASLASTAVGSPTRLANVQTIESYMTKTCHVSPDITDLANGTVTKVG